MIYRIYKETGRIGIGMEKIDSSFNELEDVTGIIGNQTPLASFDNVTNTIHIYNDKIVDVSSLLQKFKNHCDLPNKHQFTILHK